MKKYILFILGLCILLPLSIYFALGKEMFIALYPPLAIGFLLAELYRSLFINRMKE